MEAPPVELAPPVAFAKLAALESALERAIRGKAEVLRLSLVCLLSRGHLLIEDVPGVGKTTLAQALARSVDCRFHRLQFTSDMLPTDVLGVIIYNAHSEKGAAPQLTTQVILFQDGKPVFTGKQNPMTSTNQPDLKRLVGGGGIQLGMDLAPGDYVLQIIVNDALADKNHQTASQWMDFSIVK